MAMCLNERHGKAYVRMRRPETDMAENDVDGEAKLCIHLTEEYVTVRWVRTVS